MNKSLDKQTDVDSSALNQSAAREPAHILHIQIARVSA